MSIKQDAKLRLQQKLFEKERRNLQRALPKAVKAAAKGSSWRVARGTLFQERDGWFIQVHAFPWILEAKTPAELRFKPMGLDPLFWKILGMEANLDMPLSFRAFGAYTCRPPALRETDISEANGSPERVAANLLKWADEQFQSLNGSQTVSSFVEFIQTYPDHLNDGRYLTPLIVGMLLQGRDEEALSICREARVRAGDSFLNDASGFIFSRAGEMITFTQLAMEWITDKQRSRTIN